MATADVGGSYNIMRKLIPTVLDPGIGEAARHPFPPTCRRTEYGEPVRWTVSPVLREGFPHQATGARIACAKRVTRRASPA